MTIDKLIEIGNKDVKSLEDAKAALTKEIKITPYVGYAIKCAMADNIVRQCGYKDGQLYIDSAKRYYFHMLTLIMLYTNIELDMERGVAEYDRLKETGLLEVIISLIPQSEVQEFSMILSMKMEDFMTNEYSAQSFIGTQLENMSLIFSTALASGLEQVAEKLDNIDNKTLEQFVQKAVKLTSKVKK